jgi:sucrose phosphorylase
MASDAAWALERIDARLKSFPVRPRLHESLFSAKDVVLITYADSLRRSGEAPLRTLRRFANRYFQEILSTIHLLPFFPYSSDDGFSVIDYYRVHPEVGDWEDVKSLGRDFDLMFDLVLNHLSSRSPWFQNYLAGREGFERLAIEADPGADFSSVIRPRTLPLLSEYRKDSGATVHLWTTFSADQIDLNFADPRVLLRMIEVCCSMFVKALELSAWMPSPIYGKPSGPPAFIGPKPCGGATLSGDIGSNRARNHSSDRDECTP